jgi:ketosteroid isomerase-like protein
MTDLRVRVYGDVAVAMGEARAVDGAGGADEDARYHVTRVYAWRHGRWRRVAGDTTRLGRREER